MSKVRLLVGTRKGAFVGIRWKTKTLGYQWSTLYGLGDVSSQGISSRSESIYASQTSSWFGQIIQRSDDGGKTWHQPGTPPGEPTTTPDGMPKGESNKFAYDVSPETGKPLTTHQWYDGTQRPGNSSACGISNRR